MAIGDIAGLKLGPATRDAFGEALVELGGRKPEIVVVDADLANSTMASKFQTAYPDRFIEVGIAESNMVGVAAGLATCGKEAWATSFSVFLLANAYDQIRVSVAYPKLNVKLCGSHSGISIGPDGPSQMGIEDIALACALPGFTVIVPCDAEQTKAAVQAASALDGPVFIRTGRSKTPVIYANGNSFTLGKANTIREGKDITLIACGLTVALALDAAKLLADQGIEARVLDMATVKPLDEEAVAKAAKETKGIVVIEEHLLDGGLGSRVAMAAAKTSPAPMAFVAVDNTFAESGLPEDVLKKYGFTPENVVTAAKSVLSR
ncbi:MAG TPA: transketolase C-terminal domain-containing protein [Armatimonadota bacterium]|jgi:transketolase